MGLLDKLWDDTVAGPRPDTGLGRLRKHAAARPAAVKINDPTGDAAMVAVPPTTPAGAEEAPVKVTRSIMIKRPAGYPASPRSAASTPPASPAGSTPPISPFAGAVIMRDLKCSNNRINVAIMLHLWMVALRWSLQKEIIVRRI
ncbi:hypothetical protein DAI22_03g173200 [Oryza sativa Japonica Group]|nr:hypothetical protein DAI22_03g173200 [Oryza sativa Japonica Group]